MKRKNILLTLFIVGNLFGQNVSNETIELANLILKEESGLWNIRSYIDGEINKGVDNFGKEKGDYRLQIYQTIINYRDMNNDLQTYKIFYRKLLACNGDNEYTFSMIDGVISGYEQSLKTDIIMYSYLLPNLKSYNQSKFVNELLTYFKTLDAIISESK